MTETTTPLIAALTALTLITSCLLVLLFLKVRKIHIATYNITSNLSCIRAETDSIFSQIQCLLALERKLNLSEPLPRLRGWAGSPDFLLVLLDDVLNRKPTCVLECSSGTSTVVIARGLQTNGRGHVYSLEHNPLYAAKTRELLELHGLTEWATVLNAPLETKNTSTPWYSEDALPVSLPKIDLLVIDGPPHDTATMARYPALPRLIQRMSSPSAILMDDADRADESHTILQWKKEFPALETENCNCEKGCVRITFH